MAKNPETGHIPLRFKHSVAPFNATEVGGVPEAKAHALVAKGLAEYVDPKDDPNPSAAKAPTPIAAEPTADAKDEPTLDKALEEPPKHKGILHAPDKKGR